MLKPLLTALSLGCLISLLAGKISTKVPPLGNWLDPHKGMYQTARLADQEPSEVKLNGLKDKVEVFYNQRNVPHIYAQNDADAIRTFGYVVAQNRLFQLDFLPRVAQGRLSEVLGADFIKQDKFLRSTGMEEGAVLNDAYLKQNHTDVYSFLEAYADGVNQYMATLAKEDLPLEFRLLNYQPEPYSPLKIFLMMQYMNFDLSWRSDDAAFGKIRNRIGKAAFDSLYPQYYPNTLPIIPEEKGFVPPNAQKIIGMVDDALGNALEKQQKSFAGTLAQGYQEGVGSNNWAVSGQKSVTGKPILAGDPHLKVTLPSIWYEAHLSTPNFNSYGVSIPGTPVPLIGFNDYLAWTFTNTDADQIDHYALKTSEDKSRYFYNGKWENFALKFGKIKLKNGGEVADTLWASKLGKVQWLDGKAVAIRWTAHEVNRTLKAIIGFNKAQNRAEFDEASRFFDAPMQNILYADKMGNIAIRSTGKMPIRKNAYGGGILDGTSDVAAWKGFVPFEELPSSTNPTQQYLVSANQQLASPKYPYYQRITWENPYRALRIHQLLQAKAKHSVADFSAYQSDVYSIANDFISEQLRNPTTNQAFSPKSAQIAQILKNWDGRMAVNKAEPLALELFLNNLQALTWDEFKQDSRKPTELTLFNLHKLDANSKWFDIQNTQEKETAATLYNKALALTADSLTILYGKDWHKKKWGDIHGIQFNHLLTTLKPLGRGKFKFPGFRSTVSPAALHETVNTASWRMVVDFANGNVQGHGVYPGGQSGNPFSVFYDGHLKDFLYFKLNKLYHPANKANLQASEKVRKTVFLVK